MLTLLTLSMMLVAFLLLRYKVYTPAQAFEQLQPILPPCSLATTDHSAGAIAQPPLPYPPAISVRLLPLLCFFLRVDHFHPLYRGTHPIVYCGRVIVPRALPVVSARRIRSLRPPSLSLLALALHPLKHSCQTYIHIAYQNPITRKANLIAQPLLC